MLILFSKTYTTENAYRSHIQSKKHRENGLKSCLKQTSQPSNNSVPTTKAVGSLAINKNDQVIESIDEKIAAARSRLSTTSCLFCPQASVSLDDNLTHMSLAHSFFIPDAQYLMDIPGLISYLGEKIAVGNVCIYCNEKGREFKSTDAVRKHMVDKGHCKIAYDSEDDRLELSDYYDFTSSYQDAPSASKRESSKQSDEGDAESWEDMDDDNEVDDIVDGATEEASSGEDFPANTLSYGDSIYELVLPSGSRIGHRTMRRYYAQSFHGAPRGNKPGDSDSGAALVRRLLADKNSALVPRKGGFGAFGSGKEVIKARNRGEAREAGRHVKEFRDQRRREDFKTKIGFIHNSQKHFRDPCMSLCSLIALPLDEMHSGSATVIFADVAIKKNPIRIT